jgi:hypothetical protein
MTSNNYCFDLSDALNHFFRDIYIGSDIPGKYGIDDGGVIGAMIFLKIQQFKM